MMKLGDGFSLTRPFPLVSYVTFSKQSLVSCIIFVKNIADVSLSDRGVFWLGNVPCRRVRFIGMVVGVQPYEKRIVYIGESRSIV
jgi:hypothetical protein